MTSATIGSSSPYGAGPVESQAFSSKDGDFCGFTGTELTAFSHSGNVYYFPQTERILVIEPTTQWRDGVVERLNHLCSLPVGWDGYDAEAVKFSTASFALKLLESICNAKTPTPSVVPGSAGDLQIEWHLLAGDVEIHVRRPNDVVAWYCNEVTGDEGTELNLTNNFVEVAKWISMVVESSGAAVESAA